MSARFVKYSAIRTGIIVFLGLLVAFAGGCAGKSQVPNQPPVSSGQFTDSTGYVLTLPQKPQKIVSLLSSTDEILMGLVAPERIAALTYLADDSGISNISGQAKAVSRKIRANAESVIALQPDLVIISDWQPPELIQTLRETGMPVYVYKMPTSIAEIKQAIMAIAQVVGEDEAGSRLVAEMDQQLAQIAGQVKQVPDDKRQVIIRYTVMGGSDGKGSTFDDICRHAGVVNGAAAAGLEMNDSLTKEQLVAVNPDIILLPLWDYAGKTDLQKLAVELQEDPALQGVKAIRRHKLISVPDSHLVCTSQYIVQGVWDVARVAYPDYVKDE
ncbi:ABC transporter substrate-binding protein [Sporomusa acidovorans]|uniref:Fe/B12 periplasmic-binding domain-containing protein n=1 Tax=Sporomusa acidovorans (strain ATCC 49682 / DSM 3132 / Mol) TaxID=1123286 RepID=A0ABZ3IYN9_SPOA4|nr:ABC transporter substrate-binding protein [Sporomusa acidovorans]OZC17660.1 iron-uptake system-binding protein precursor [Sporomusa acidovorans DSM 3132]SDE11284.1 iron complex transport system substrate-binding protein [Sporomusa acidovorans]